MATAILLDDPKPPSKARIHAKVSPHIEAVCLKALSKEPVDRFQNAEEFRAALESAFLEHEAAGGDEALDAYSANSLDGDVVNSVDSATIAAHTPVPMPSVKANSRSKNKLILPLVVAAAVVLGIIVALLLTSGGEGAKETEETVKESSNESEANAGDETSGDGVGGTDPEKNGGIQPLETSPDPVDLNPDEAGNPSEKVGANDTTNDASKDPATDENPEKGDADDETRAAEEEVVDPVAEKKKSDRREAKKLLKEGLAADGSSAISKLKKAVKLDPRLWEAWEALGDAYLRKSNRKAAARAYKKVLKYKPSHRRKRVMEKVIESAN